MSRCREEAWVPDDAGIRRQRCCRPEHDGDCDFSWALEESRTQTWTPPSRRISLDSRRES